MFLLRRCSVGVYRSCNNSSSSTNLKFFIRVVPFVVLRFTTSLTPARYGYYGVDAEPDQGDSQDLLEQISNLRDTDLAHEVTYAESFLKFRKFLRKNGKLKTSVDQSVEDFIRTNPPRVNAEHERIIEKFSEKFDFVAHFRAENETFMNVFDFALTQTTTWEESQLMLILAGKKFSLDTNIKSNYLDFYKKITELARVVGPKDNVSLPEILTSPDYPLDVDIYRKKEDFYQNLERLYDDFVGQVRTNEPGTLNKNHLNHKILLKINELCHRYVRETSKNKEPEQYLLKVFNYLKAFSKILYIEQNSSDIISKGKNTSYFEIFNLNRSELTGKLLFEKQLDPTEFEKYFGKLLPHDQSPRPGERNDRGTVPRQHVVRSQSQHHRLHPEEELVAGFHLERDVQSRRNENEHQ
jgi:hypothetical protein